MKFEVYCDESLPDLFTSTKPHARYLMIGALWVPAELRAEVKTKILQLRERYNVWGEMKWRKISASKQVFYQELIDLFVGYGMDMRFRCIAVDQTQVNLELHQNDGELGFYKFYYQLLHHWILDFNDYRVICDVKTNRSPRRLADLRRCLSNANLSSTVTDIQSLPSSEVALLQLCDVLLGAASSRINCLTTPGTAKEIVLQRLESHLNTGKVLGPTPKAEEKFNIFKIRLKGGW